MGTERDNVEYKGVSSSEIPVTVEEAPVPPLRWLQTLGAWLSWVCTVRTGVWWRQDTDALSSLSNMSWRMCVVGKQMQSKFPCYWPFVIGGFKKKGQLWWYLCCQSEWAVEQTVDQLGSRDATAFPYTHPCNLFSRLCLSMTCNNP